MATDTPSPADSMQNAQHSTPHSDDIANSGPSAPSDFLKHLPSSAERPFADAEPAVEQDLAEHGFPDPVRVQVDAHGRALNPRSCVTCRKRKVKCDKVHPCSNCNRAHIECVFPAPGRAPRKIRKIGEGRDKELLERLRRLEGVVKGMGVEVPRDEKDGRGTPDPRLDARMQSDSANDFTDSAGANEAKISYSDDIDHKNKVKWVEERQDRNFENRFGRLVVNEGKSRYINNSFWANLSTEVEDLKGILNETSEEDDAVEPPVATPHPSGNQQGWVFGFGSQNVDLLALHPLPGQIRVYWETFKDRVDPLVKVLHIPSIDPTILSAASNLSNLSRGFEALLFAIYYGATTSLNPSDCLQTFGEEKSVLLARYRFGIQQALARASFLTTEEVIVLQAFVIFLICLRRNNDARVIWTLTGLVVRIAQTIGVHRDGSHFGLAPFEVEMRRRLWWQVCILDTRASEDHGCDPTIIEQAFDTKMPLNINDSDMSPDMKDFPPERQGCTDMSFCLIRFEVAATFRRINYIPPGPPQACTDYFANVTLQDKEKWITECHHRLEDRYLKHCDMTVPLFWVTATVARLMMSKMWLMVYHPFQRHDGGASLPQETKEKLFITSLENIEYSLLLETESRTMKWGWLFKTYMQWHALAFILSELCQKTMGDLVERAWTAIEKTRDGRWGTHVTADSPTGHLWRPLKKLYRKAAEARQRGLQEEILVKQRVSSAPMRTYSPGAGQTFDLPKKTTSPPVGKGPVAMQRMPSGHDYGQLSPDLFMAPKRAPVKEPADSTAMDVTDSHREATVPPPIKMPPQQHPDLAVRQMRFTPQHSPITEQQGQVPQLSLQTGPPPQYGQQFFVNTNTPTIASTQQMDFNNLNSSPLSIAHSNMSNPNIQNLTLSGSSRNISPRNLSSSALPTHNMSNPNLASLSNSNPHTPHNPRQHMRTVSYDSTQSHHAWGGPGDTDMSAMDTSGTLDWENWDQLVKQFGMNQGPQPGGGGPTDWSGGNWSEVLGGGPAANVRMNMGMGGGDWF